MPPIKTAILSYGLSGKVFHAPFIDLHPGFELTGVWERSKKLIKEVYPSAKSYDTLAALLADDIDLVVINTPSYSHYEYAKKALLAGKNIVVEKPFTTTVAQGEELKAIAEEKHLLICPYQNRRWNSDYRTVKRILDEGWLGEIVEAEIHYDRFNSVLSPKAHKETPGPGTGIVNDLGSHLIDQALQMFGWPEAVFADIDITREGSLVDDYMEILLYYPKLRVRLKSGYFIREALPGYMIYGKKGTFLKSKADPQEDQLVAGMKLTDPYYGIEPETEQGLLHTEKDGKVIREKVPTEKGDFMGYYDGLHKALTQNQALPVTVDEGINVIRIIEASYASNKERRAVKL